MNKINKIFSRIALASTPLLMFFSGGAAAVRVAESQATYWQVLVELIILVATSALFLASLLILLAGGWFFIRDYVLAKADHEKKFSIGQLVASIFVAGLLGYPTGAYLLGQDLSVGENNGQEATADDFKRTTQ